MRSQTQEPAGERAQRLEPAVAWKEAFRPRAQGDQPEWTSGRKGQNWTKPGVRIEEKRSASRRCLRRGGACLGVEPV